MPARRNVAAYEGGARNAKQFDEPAPHFEVPPSVSVPSRFTIVMSGADRLSCTPASRLAGSEGSAIVLEAGTMSPAQPIVTFRSGAAAVVVPPEAADVVALPVDPVSSGSVSPAGPS